MDKEKINEEFNPDDFIEDYAEEEEIPQENNKYRYNIDSYTNAIPVEILVRDFSEGRIIIPEFQRPYVWNLNDPKTARHKPSLFVDSLLQGLPIPPISIYRNARDRDCGLLIDGQQRIKTLAWFINGNLEGRKKSFLLHGEGINSSWSGRDFENLDQEDKNTLLRAYIPVTFIRQLNEDKPPLPEGSSLFILFDRLNSGGAQLKPHEKRSVLAIHNKSHKILTGFLKYLYNLPQWDQIIPSTNLDNQPWRITTHHELIFRVFAFALNKNNYNGNIARFLDDFMLNINLSEETAEKLKTAISTTLTMLVELKKLKSRLFIPSGKFNTSFYEVFTVCLLNRFMNNKTTKVDNLLIVYNKIENEKLYLGKEAGDKSSNASKKVVIKRYENISKVMDSYLS